MGTLQDTFLEKTKEVREVSIQLVSPTSGDLEKITGNWKNWDKKVSIQLVSLTSGDSKFDYSSCKLNVYCVHSISFPNEWGHDLERIGRRMVDLQSFHSISFPNEWGLSSNL